jgi:hypothetical protein
MEKKKIGSLVELHVMLEIQSIKMESGREVLVDLSQVVLQSVELGAKVRGYI